MWTRLSTPGGGDAGANAAGNQRPSAAGGDVRGPEDRVAGPAPFCQGECQEKMVRTAIARWGGGRRWARGGIERAGSAWMYAV